MVDNEIVYMERNFGILILTIRNKKNGEKNRLLTFVMKQITSFPKKDKGVNSVYFPRLKMLSDVMLK